METQTKNPWQTLATKVVYDNPWIHVREDSVTRPDGEPGIYGVVSYKNVATGVLAIDKNGDTVLVGQHRYTLDAYSWELPEGGCPVGEDPLLAAQRELKEETGMTARSWELLGHSHLSNSVSDEELFYYLATDLEEGEPSPEGTEDLRVKKVPFAEALQMVLDGEITDSVSVIAILRYAVVQNIKS